MKIRIGTRKSKLALAQTQMVETALRNAFPHIETEIVHIVTKGDKVLDKPLSQIGGKGLFITEIEQALLNNEIDIAVHSAKDLPVFLAEGLETPGVLKRGDPRDCLITRKGCEFSDSEETVVGTGSMRRRMQVKKLYPCVSFSDIRGNIDTRIGKLLNGEYDGIILAMAGLERLNIKSDDRIQVRPFGTDLFLPAPCQGIIAAECRKNDIISEYIKKINDADTYCAFETERAVVKKVNGDCGIPLGAYSEVNGSEIALSLSMNPDLILKGTDKLENRFRLAERLAEKL
ncbi:MAG: hydroxymethylbilane synthase [Ruminococcus sp.]